MRRVGDAEPEFFGATACATLLAVGADAASSTLFGPTNIPAGSAAVPRTAWTTVSQSAVTGTGTSGNPFRVVTVVLAGTTGIEVTQTDSYVEGADSYRTDVNVRNTGPSSQRILLYRAGDCFLQDSDSGFGTIDTIAKTVACATSLEPGARILQFNAITRSGVNLLESDFNQVWAAVGTRLPFDDTCRCAERIDNGTGLSWVAQVPASGTLRFSHLITFSPLGIEPLVTSKIVDDGSVSSGDEVRYEISVSNSNASAITVGSITDTLPASFSYLANSTSGATTDEPAISGADLSWDGPFEIPSESTITLSFSAVAAGQNGTYFNNASASSDDTSVVPTGDTASVEIGGGGGGGSDTIDFVNRRLSDERPSRLARFTGSEATRRIVVKVERIGSGEGEASVDLVLMPIVPGSATPGTDYDPTTITVTFADGETGVKNVRVPVVGDRRRENRESFRAVLTHSDNADIGRDALAIMTIKADRRSGVGYRRSGVVY